MSNRWPIAIATLLLGQELAAQGLGAAAEREKKRRDEMRQRVGEARVLTDRDLNPDGPWVGWREFRPKAGAFSVLMPSRPQMEQDTVQVAGGSVSTLVPRLIYRAREGDGGAEASVSYAEFPLDFVRSHGSDLWSHFQNEPREPGDTDTVLPGELGGHPAVVFLGQRKQTYGCLVGRRFFELVLIVPPDEPLPRDEVHPFFGSFKIMPE
jgi:hypothetical protein